jgi:predicted aconitase
MFLTRKEERILSGQSGWVLARAMRLLVALGEAGGAERFVPIKRSQVSGVSYKTAGEPTLELLESLSAEGVSVQTYATLNPAGMDLERWREMGINEGFAEKQRRICSAYERLGVKALCTCTPYLSNNKPRYGERVGFSESSAVAYVNSVIGARSNRHGGLDALSAALVGKVPLMGYLLDENRLSDVLVKVKFKPVSESDYGALGYLVGKSTEMDSVPCYEGLREAARDELKLLGAASAASGSTAIYHVLGVTPEACKTRPLFKGGRPSDTLEVGREDIASVYDELSSSTKCDLVALGCPHCSIEEVKRVALLLKGRRVRRRTRLWVFTSPNVYDEALRQGYVREIQASGGDVFRHTCMVVMPIEDIGITGVATNSAKAAFYIPRMSKCQVKLLSLKDCIEFATYV